MNTFRRSRYTVVITDGARRVELHRDHLSTGVCGESREEFMDDLLRYQMSDPDLTLEDMDDIIHQLDATPGFDRPETTE